MGLSVEHDQFAMPATADPITEASRVRPVGRPLVTPCRVHPSRTSTRKTINTLGNLGVHYNRGRHRRRLQKSTRRPAHCARRESKSWARAQGIWNMKLLLKWLGTAAILNVVGHTTGATEPAKAPSE